MIIPRIHIIDGLSNNPAIDSFNKFLTILCKPIDIVCLVIVYYLSPPGQRASDLAENTDRMILVYSPIDLNIYN